MWRSLFTFITRFFDTASASLGTIEKAIDIGNDYVSNQHKALTRGFAKQAMLDTATQHAGIQAKLEEDPKLATIFAELEAEWDLPSSEWAKLPLPTPKAKAKK